MTQIEKAQQFVESVTGEPVTLHKDYGGHYAFANKQGKITVVGNNLFSGVFEIVTKLSKNIKQQLNIV